MMHLNGCGTPQSVVFRGGKSTRHRSGLRRKYPQQQVCAAIIQTEKEQKTMKRVLGLLLMLLSVVAISAKDIKTVILTTTPQMKCEKCENHIKETLRFVKGVKDVQPSHETQKIVIVYDADKTKLEKIQQELEKLGFKSRQTTEEEVIEPGEQTECSSM